MPESRLHRFLDWLHDLPLLARLWIADWFSGPMPETLADQIREQRREKLRQLFPKVDFDNPPRR